MPRHKADPKAVSPKVTGATAGGSLGIVLAYLFAQVPFIAHQPQAVQGAELTLLVAAITFGAGYLQRDPARG